MKGAFVIARLTLIETMRRQIQLITFFIAVGIFMLPMAVNAFALGASDRVVKDIALTIIGWYGVLLSVFFGSIAIPGEVERKTLYPIVTKPIPRRAYLWGKWLGLMGFIAFSLVVLSLFLATSMRIYLDTFDTSVFKAVLGYICEDAVLSATCVLFSTFSSPPLAAVLGLFVYFVGGLPNAFLDYFLQKSWVQVTAATGLKTLLPHYEYFHLKNAVVHGEAFPSTYLLAIIGYAAVWVFFVQLLAEAVFDRRDL